MWGLKAARINLKAMATAAGPKKAELADPKKAERATGFVVGGISPFGLRKQFRAFIDTSATSLDGIVVNGGRRGLQIVLKSTDLIRAASAAVVPLQS